MGLFGNLFGSSLLPLITGEFPIDNELLETVRESIDDYLPTANAVWNSIPGDSVADPDQPWKTRITDGTEHPVKIIFYPRNLQDRQFTTYLSETERTDGAINGIMYKTDFDPKLKDTVSFNGRELTVNTIDILSPFKATLLYILEFNT